MQSSSQKLSIQEASQRLKVTKHTLRFWEKKLDGVIVPLRTQGGQRRYASEHLCLIEEIKRLKKKGLSLIDIKKKFDKRYNAHNLTSRRIDLLANQLAELIKSAVYNFFDREY